ncbi:MAG: aspartate-semialdehyde dehydrogenase [Azospirillaceae bacterium]|nr:aspartate-semialdehyde dehydrogenase [Azospirillaceae bacterium]
MAYKVAVIGATGNVGREMLAILAEREFPVSEIVALASEKSIGSEVSFGDDQILKVRDLAKFDFKGFDLALSSPSPAISARFTPIAAKAGCVVIDNTPGFRMDPDIPLIVPEINGDAMAAYSRRNIIANPGATTVQMAIALKPLHDLAAIKRVVVSTYQSVSSAGRDAMDELFTQTRSIYVNDPIVKERFPKQIAFNVIPHIDEFLDDGATKAEWEMMVELKKILDPRIAVTATCVQVPVFIGHALSINVEFEQPIGADEAREALRNAPGIQVIDRRVDDGYVTPVECAGDDLIYVSRIREDFTVENGLNLWVVGDNLRKGAALNSVQTAELLVQDYF